MVLKKKTNINPPDPKGPPAWALAIRDELIAMFNQRLDKLEEKQDKDHKLLIEVIELNNLKTK